MSELKAHIAKVASGKPLDFRRGALGVRHHHVRRGDAQPDRRVPDGAARARRDRRRDLRRGRHDAREDAEGRGARRRHRHRRHRRRRLAQRQHLDGLGLRDRRRRRAGRQARQSRPVLADRRRRRAHRARRQDRHHARYDRPLHSRGRRRLHVRAGAPSGDAPCRPDAARARHAHDLQPARAAVQSGRRQAADGRRVRARMGRAAGRNAEGARHRAGLGRAWRRLRRDHHDRRDARLANCPTVRSGALRSRRNRSGSTATGARICAAAMPPSTRARCATCSKARPAPIATRC